MYACVGRITPRHSSVLIMELFPQIDTGVEDTVALVNSPVVDAVPASPEGQDSVNLLAPALVNAVELGQGSNSRRGQS
jgi:hypothetical protein